MDEPFCEATTTCEVETHRLKAKQMAKKAQLEQKVRLISEKERHNWFPRSERRYMDAGDSSQGAHSSKWYRFLNILVGPLLFYSTLERNISVYCDGNILRQLQEGAPLNQLRGKDNQYITSLEQLIQLMGSETCEFFFPNLHAGTKFSDINVLRAPTETAEYLMDLLKTLGFNDESIGKLGDVKEFAQTFDVTYATFYRKICNENMYTLESFKLTEGDYNALKARAQDIIESRGFNTDVIKTLKLTMDVWKRLGATAVLLRSIPLTQDNALQCWKSFYNNTQACQHAFERTFDCQMSFLDEEFTVGAESANGGDAQPLDTQQSPRYSVKQVSLLPLSATTT